MHGLSAPPFVVLVEHTTSAAAPLSTTMAAFAVTIAATLLTAVIRGAWQNVCVARKSPPHTSTQLRPFAGDSTQPEVGLPMQFAEPAGVAAPHVGQSAQALRPVFVREAPNVPTGHFSTLPTHEETDVCPTNGPNLPASHAVPAHAVADEVCPVAVAYLPATVAVPQVEPHAFACEVVPVAVPYLPAPQAPPHAFASEVWPVAVPYLPAPQTPPHAFASEV